MALSYSRTAARVSSSSNNGKIPINNNARISSLNRSFDAAGTAQRPKAPQSRRSLTPVRSQPSHDSEPGRVRVAVRVRPKNAEELASDVEFADIVELQSELKRIKLKKNNWDSESYKFDEVFSASSSQRRIYEVVAKPVVESVLSGYNGTVMAYGQTGTGKTYTLGRLGKDDASERGIMVRAMEDILASVSSEFDSIEVSFLQLYMESVQDLLAPEKTNIPIVEDPKTGEVSLPGAVLVKIRDLDQFLQLLQSGESNRHAANTMMNTESSRSHAILMVHIRRSCRDHESFDTMLQNKESESNLTDGRGVPTIRKSKLLIVDLAGSERIDKSGSKGHLLEEAKFINLSLSSLGKCINALAENSPHIPIRDSKLTRLLRDSFGGSARTSLIITIGPSARHHGETTSTIMFGQRAMKIVNVVKLKEEFDYEYLCRSLENEVEHLNVEIDRQQKLRDSDRIELEKKLTEYQKFFAEAEKCLVARSEFLEKENVHLEREIKNMVIELDHLKEDNGSLQGEVARLEMSLNQSKQCQDESSTYQKVLADTTQMYEKKIADMTKQLEEEEARSAIAEKELEKMRALLNDCDRSLQHCRNESSSYQKALAETTQMYEIKISERIQELDDMRASFEGVEKELNTTKKQLFDLQNLKETQVQTEIQKLKAGLDESGQLQQKSLNEFELLKSENTVLLGEKATLTEEVSALRDKLFAEEKQRKAAETELNKLKKIVPESDDNFEDKKPYMKENVAKPLGLHKSNQLRETTSGQRATIAKYCEEVGLEKILKSLTSGDIDVQIHAVKLVANLAAEDINQEKIVEEGGLDALLMLLQSSQSTTVLRVASGAIANLAMNEINQTLIVTRGGARLLANTASKTDDPQTLRMVAGAIANLCGNEKLHFMLIEGGATKALVGMARSGNSEVIAQVARGIANFAKCESRVVVQGHRKGRSELMEDGAFTWLLANCSMSSSSSRRHIELALCHLAQNEDNASDFIKSGGAEELARISVESTREDIRILAKKTLKQLPLKAERV